MKKIKNKKPQKLNLLHSFTGRPAAFSLPTEYTLSNLGPRTIRHDRVQSIGVRIHLTALSGPPIAHHHYMEMPDVSAPLHGEARLHFVTFYFNSLKIKNQISKLNLFKYVVRLD